MALAATAGAGDRERRAALRTRVRRAGLPRGGESRSNGTGAARTRWRSRPGTISGQPAKSRMLVQIDPRHLARPRSTPLGSASRLVEETAGAHLRGRARPPGQVERLSDLCPTTSRQAVPQTMNPSYTVIVYGSPPRSTHLGTRPVYKMAIHGQWCEHEGARRLSGEDVGGCG